MASAASECYHGLVDMGSNGIRFSITDLRPPTARILPTVFLDRAAISLYDAQWKDGQQVPIPEEVITEVIKALCRFKEICQDFGVSDDHVRIVATEATRKAKNSADFCDSIRSATGWAVDLLPKEQEGRIGAYGVASSYDQVNGLVMDLGGGSTQITWVLTDHEDVRMSSKGSISFPYGAAALTREIEEAKKRKKGKAELKERITNELETAVKELGLPEELKAIGKSTGLPLYLSGGGFRGWGYVLMDQHPVKPYPIPIINGFQVDRKTFHDTDSVLVSIEAATTAESEASDIFRVSDRRASQIPAVAFLVSCLSDVLKDIKDVFFCQGGVREGIHFSNLSHSVRCQSPLLVASLPHAPKSADLLLHLLDAALPFKTDDNPGVVAGKVPSFFASLTVSFINLLFIHASLPKDLRAASALRSTISGLLAGVHGVSHAQRAALALMLCERHGGRKDISPADQDFHTRLARLLDSCHIEAAVWWCLYIGRIGALLAEMYPAGVVRENRLVSLRARWMSSSSSHNNDKKMNGSSNSNGIAADADADENDNNNNNNTKKKSHKKHKKGKLIISLDGPRVDWARDLLHRDNVQAALTKIEKLDKRKNWAGSEIGYAVETSRPNGVSV